MSSGNDPSAAAFGVAPQPKLLDRMRIHLRTRHYSIRTEEAYVDWARRFILFHHKRHPQDMGAQEVESFLSYLAVERHVSASTQNQAKAALLYLYKQVLGIHLPWLDEVAQARRPTSGCRWCLRRHRCASCCCTPKVRRGWLRS